MLNYIYKKYKDTYTIQNTGITTLTYTIYKKDCDIPSLVTTGTILPGTISTLPIKHIDGVYSVVISDGLEDFTLPDILFYNNLLLSIIANSLTTLCGDCHDCKACNDCGKDGQCDIQLKTITSMLAFATVHNPTYNEYFSAIADTMKCTVNEEVLCYLSHSTIRGKEEATSMLLQIIGKYYLTFYLYDLLMATDVAEAEYIKAKYKSVQIMKCLKKLGINIDETFEILTDMEQAKVYYWQLPLNTIPEEGITPDYLLLWPSLDFSVFEAGYTVNYSVFGKIYFAITPTNILTFQLTDSLGNDVTDEFDKVVDNTNNIVSYISKDNYAPSNIFFKFKPVTYV